MFDEILSLFDELIEAAPTKKTSKKSPKKKRKKKIATGLGGGGPPTSRQSKTIPKINMAPKKHPKAANDDEATSIVNKSIGSMGLYLNVKMDTSPKAMNAYNQSLKAFVHPDKVEDKKEASSEKPDEAKSVSNKPYFHSKVIGAIKDLLKANPDNAKDMAQGVKDLREEKAKDPTKTTADIVKANPNNKHITKLALGIGLGVAAAGLFVGLSVISPGIAIMAGMHTIDHLITSDVGNKLLDHFLLKEDKDETEDARSIRPNTVDEDQETEDAKVEELHRKGNSLLGDHLPETVSQIVENVQNDPKVAQQVADDLKNGIKKHDQDKDLEPVSGKTDAIKSEWAKRLEKHQAILNDPNTSEEDKEHSKKIHSIARKIIGGSASQEEALKSANTSKEEPKSEEENNEDDDGYESTVEHVTKSGKINVADIKKATNLDDETIKNHLDDMEDEGIVSKPDKQGNRKVLMSYDDVFDDGEDNNDDEPDDTPPPKGNKVKAELIESSDIDQSIDIINQLSFDFDNTNNSWSQIAAILNLGIRKPGHVRGSGQDDLDNIGENYVDFRNLENNDDYDVIRNKSGKIIDHPRNPVESLLDIENDYTKHIKAPTYASLKLNPVSSRLLVNFCKNNGIENTYSKHEMHITVCYSKKPIDYKTMIFTDGPKQVFADKFDLLGRNNDEKYVVLKLKKGFPHQRFEYAKSLGASHDFPEYLPHISISPPEKHNMTREKLDKINSTIIHKLPPLLIDYEYMDELKPEDDISLPVGFKAKTMEDARRMADAFAESVASLKMEANKTKIPFKIEAITKDTAYDILGKKLVTALNNDKSMIAYNVKAKIWEIDPEVIKFKERRKDKNIKYDEKMHNEVNDKALAKKESFDTVWNLVSKQLGSDKYVYNVLQWYCGTNKNPPSLTRLEDIGRVKSALALKERFKDTINKEPDLHRYRDLNQITFKQLEDLAEILKARITANQEKAGYEESLIKSEQATILYNDDEWKVVIPKTEEAAKYYGRNTRWCTAADTNNMYLEYAKDGDLYVFIHKKDNRKWQLHFETGQLMDAKDDPVEYTDYADPEYKDLEDANNSQITLLGPIITKVIPFKYMKLRDFDTSLNSKLIFPYLNDQDKLNYIKQYGIFGIQNPNIEQQIVAVKSKVYNIMDINWPCKEAQLYCVNKDPSSINFFGKQACEEAMLIAVKADPYIIKYYLPKVTQKVADAAFDAMIKKYPNHYKTEEQKEQLRYSMHVVPVLPFDEHFKNNKLPK